MSDTRSFEKLNYTIRPNKNVERKLIAELLKMIGSTKYFDIPNYCYIGLGSIWFSDFSLFHRFLGISNMISIEKEKSRKKRLEFNVPFDCVDLKLGLYTDVFPELKWDKRTIVWLDFDGTLSSQMFDDLKRTLLMVGSGSIVFISANADSWQLDQMEVQGTRLAPPDALRQLVDEGDLPAGYESRLGRAQFPALVGEIFSNAFVNTVAKRSDLNFEPVMNLAYADNVPMVTFGGIILDQSDSEQFAKISMTRLQFLVGPPQFELSVPNLTNKEKSRFDQLLPKGNSLSQLRKNLAFELRDTEIEAYARFYLHYPVYGEFQF